MVFLSHFGGVIFRKSQISQGGETLRTEEKEEADLLVYAAASLVLLREVGGLNVVND